MDVLQCCVCLSSVTVFLLETNYCSGWLTVERRLLATWIEVAQMRPESMCRVAQLSTRDDGEGEGEWLVGNRPTTPPIFTPKHRHALFFFKHTTPQTYAPAEGHPNPTRAATNHRERDGAPLISPHPDPG